MKNVKKRKYNPPDGSFLNNHDDLKKHKAEVLAYENQLPIDWHEVKIIVDATVVDKYLKNRKCGSKISPSHPEKISVQKIPRVNQDVFTGKNDVMVKLEIPSEDIRVDDNLSPEDSLVFDDAPVKQEGCNLVLDTDTLDNDTFHDGEFAESLREVFECRDNDKYESLTVEIALKNEVVESESCYEEIIIGQESKDALKNEELFVGQEFKHEESIPSYENVESINEENNEGSIKKSTRSSRKRKKCLDCDDCSHELTKKLRPDVHDQVVVSKLPVKEPKSCSEKSQTPSKSGNSKSSLRAKEQKTSQESLHIASPAIPQPQKSDCRGYHCAHCVYKGRRPILIKHFRNKHPYLFPNDSVRCPNCDMKFNSWEEMQKHRSVCLLFLICKFCLVHVPSRPAMVRHMKKVHPEKICAKKGERIIDKLCLNSMTGAMKTLEITPFGQRYAEIRNYYSEMESELIKLHCPECVVTHDKITSRRAPRCDSCESRLLFQCQKCKDTRSHYVDVWKHLISKSSSCSIFKNLPFTDHEESSNATGQASSNEPNPHDCEICDFKEATRTQLYEHVLNVHLDKGIIKNGHHTCSKCGASFRFGNVRLKRHRELCGIADRFPCRFCPMTCFNTKNLSDHISIMHYDELDGRDINDFLKEALNFRRMVKKMNVQRFNDKLRNGKAETAKDYYHNGIESMLKPVCIECKTDGPEDDPRNREYCAKCQARSKFVCLKCDELFSKYSAAWVHATRTCENRSFTLTVVETCKYPAKVDVSSTDKELLYGDKSILCNHIKHTHPQSHEIQGHFKCPKCYRSFDNSGELHQHRLRCRAGFYYTCHFCHRTSTDFEAIENHITNEHANRVRCRDTLDEILQKVIENKRAWTAKTSNRFDKFGRMIRRTFSENVKLATFYCAICDENVHKDFRFISDTRMCPKCNGELRIHCKICNRSFSKWELISMHFQRTGCGSAQIKKQPWMETYEMDHSYSLRQPPPEVTKSSATEG